MSTISKLLEKLKDEFISLSQNIEEEFYIRVLLPKSWGLTKVKHIKTEIIQGDETDHCVDIISENNQISVDNLFNYVIKIKEFGLLKAEKKLEAERKLEEIKNKALEEHIKVYKQYVQEEQSEMQDLGFLVLNNVDEDDDNDEGEPEDSTTEED